MYIHTFVPLSGDTMVHSPARDRTKELEGLDRGIGAVLHHNITSYTIHTRNVIVIEPLSFATIISSD